MWTVLETISYQKKGQPSLFAGMDVCQFRYIWSTVSRNIWGPPLCGVPSREGREKLNANGYEDFFNERLRY